MIISSLSRTTRTFLSLIVILLLLQKNQIYVHGFPTETCSSRDRKYTHNGVCCYMCPPGYRVESHCQLNLDDSSCKPCPQGYFQGDWNSQTDCFRVNLCNKSHEHVAEEANKDGTSDNTCACDVGYEYSGSGERCRKAALTVIVTPRSHITDVTTTNALSSSSWSWFWSSSSPPPSPTPKTGSKVSTGDSSKLTIHILVALLCSVIFFVILGLALWRWRKKIRVCIKQQENRKQIETIASGIDDTGPPSYGEQHPMVPNPTQAGSQPSFEDRGHETSTENGEIPRHANGHCNGGERMPMIPASTRATPVNQPSNRRGDGHRTDSVTSRRTNTETQRSSHPRSRSDPNNDNADEVRPMSEVNVAVLRKMKAVLSKDMPLNPTLDRMYTVFSREDEAEITKESLNNINKGRKLIDILISKDNSAFNTFVRVLKEVSPHLAAALEKEKAKHRR